jgi:hypothetical protein
VPQRVQAAGTPKEAAHVGQRVAGGNQPWKPALEGG